MSEKLKLAEKTALDIDRLRDGYRPAARRGAILFFVLSEMALVNAMYQYSLNAFLDVFGFSLKKSLPDSILMKRLRNIMDTLTFNIYNYGCTGERPPPSRQPRAPRAGRPADGVPAPSPYRDVGQVGPGRLTASSSRGRLFRGPASKDSHVSRSSGSGLPRGLGGAGGGGQKPARSTPAGERWRPSLP